MSTIVLGVLLVIVSLSKCGGDNSDKKYSEAEVQEIANNVYAQAMADVQAQEAVPEVDDSVEVAAEDNTPAQESTTESGSTLPAALKEKAYKEGYDYGMLHHTMELKFYTKENEKNLKDDYMTACRAYDGLGEENYNNRELYNIYRSGFMKGYEDGNNALN